MPTPTDFTAFASGRLIAQLATGVTTGVTLQANRINGSYVTFPTGAFLLTLYRKTESDIYCEVVHVAAGTTQNSTTGVVTLGTLTRNLSRTDGSDFAGSAATVTHQGGTLCFIGWNVQNAEQALYKDVANTLTGAGAIRSNSTSTAVVRFNSVTTAQRTAMTADNGDVVYDSDLGQLFQYIGGAWTAIGNTGTANASSTVAGKVELATDTEIRAETGNGGSGAPVVIPASSTAVLKDDRIVLKDATEKTISSGAITVDQAYHNVDTEGDASSDDLDTITAAVGVGEVIILVANNTNRTVVIKHNTGNIKLADGRDFSLDDTEKSIMLLKQSGNWIEISRGRGASWPFTEYVGTTDSNQAGQSSTSEVDVDQSLTIAANTLAVGDDYQFDADGFFRSETSASTIRLKLSSTTLASLTQALGADGHIDIRSGFTVRSIGASGSVQPYMIAEIYDGTTLTRKITTNLSPVTVDTTGSLVFKMSNQAPDSDSRNGLKFKRCRITKFRV